MSDVFHTETYTHKSGKNYHVELSYDHDHGAPQDNCDGHGVVIELDFDPTDTEEVAEFLDYRFDEDEDDDRRLEEEARLQLMRVLRYRQGRHDNLVCYDVWATLTKAREEGWGMSEKWKAEHPDATENDILMAAIDQDFKYLEGWYDDRWHWCVVGVAPLDEDGEPIEEHRQYCGGYESTIVNYDQRKWFEEVIEDQIHEVEWALRRELHKGQMELELVCV